MLFRRLYSRYYSRVFWTLFVIPDEKFSEIQLSPRIRMFFENILTFIMKHFSQGIQMKMLVNTYNDSFFLVLKVFYSFGAEKKLKVQNSPNKND